MKYCLFITLVFTGLLLKSQTTITVINNTCEPKEVTVFFDDPTPNCVASPTSCTTLTSITQTIDPDDDFANFSVPCSLDTYRVTAQSVNLSSATATWYRSSCGTSNTGSTPSADACPGTGGYFSVDQNPTNSNEFDISNY